MAGSSDLISPRSAVMERSCFSLAAGLMRDAVGKSDVGAKTRPPRARAEASATVHPNPRAAMVAMKRPECVRNGVGASMQVAGDGALQAVMKEAAPGQGKTRHHGKENEDSGHAGGRADKIAAARDLPFFAGLLAPARGCLFGLVGFRHKSVASSQFSVVSSQCDPNQRASFKILSEASRALPKRASKKRGQ